jgi:hypothetical protein
MSILIVLADERRGTHPRNSVETLALPQQHMHSEETILAEMRSTHNTAPSEDTHPSHKQTILGEARRIPPNAWQQNLQTLALPSVPKQRCKMTRKTMNDQNSEYPKPQRTIGDPDH